MYNGLRKRQTYDELVDFISNDPVKMVYPDRRATQLRESPYLTQLDGEGMRQMEQFELNLTKKQQQKHILKALADQTGQSVAEITAAEPQTPHSFTPYDIFGNDPSTEGEEEDEEYHDPDTTGPINVPPLIDVEPPAIIPPAPAEQAEVPGVAILEPEAQPSIIETPPDLPTELAAQSESLFNLNKKKLKAEIKAVRASDVDKTQKIEQLNKQLQDMGKKHDEQARLLDEKDQKLNDKIQQHDKWMTDFDVSRAAEIKRIEEEKAQFQLEREQHQRDVEEHRRQVEAILAGQFTPQTPALIQAQRQAASSTALQPGSMGAPLLALGNIGAPRGGAKRRSTSAHVPREIQYQAAPELVGGELMHMSDGQWRKAALPTLQQQLKHRGVSLDVISGKLRLELIDMMLQRPDRDKP